MPKKKKKDKGKKKGKKDEAAKGEGGTPKAFEVPGASDKELTLRKELNDLDIELATLKQQVKDLRQENEWLQSEAEQTRQETHDYQTYISRKSEKRQCLIVSLSDHYQQQLKTIAREKEEIIKDHEEKKSGLNAILMEKQAELSKIQHELKALEPFKKLQKEQEAEICQLEQQLELERFAHEDKIRSIKTQFLKQKRQLEEASEAKIKEMVIHANKEASECLKKHNQRIQVENHRLRRELQELIEVTNALQLHKKRLERQYRNVIREHQFSQSLMQLRGSVFRGQELTADLDLQLGEYEPESEVGLPQLKLS